MNVQVAPSILAADFTRLGEQLQECQAAGADLVHIDVMDGHFVPNITLGPLVVAAVRRACTLPRDVHLMIEEPDRSIDAFIAAGADRISVHWEACPNLHRTLQHIRAAGVQAGVALNPHTPAAMLVEILPLVDAVIVMTVNPGFGGQEFLQETMPKLAQLRRMLGEMGHEADLVVDGGIQASTAVTAVQHGASTLVAGSAVFGYPTGIAEGIAALRAAAGRAPAEGAEAK
jgi:ribulose-phosphate 3-epimerase